MQDQTPVQNSTRIEKEKWLRYTRWKTYFLVQAVWIVAFKTSFIIKRFRRYNNKVCLVIPTSFVFLSVSFSNHTDLPDRMRWLGQNLFFFFFFFPKKHWQSLSHILYKKRKRKPNDNAEQLSCIMGLLLSASCRNPYKAKYSKVRTNPNILKSSLVAFSTFLFSTTHYIILYLTMFMHFFTHFGHLHTWCLSSSSSKTSRSYSR